MSELQLTDEVKQKFAEAINFHTSMIHESVRVSEEMQVKPIQDNADELAEIIAHAESVKAAAMQLYLNIWKAAF